ncbi:MAG: hypothetical protein IAF38_07950 [Bacteroidia bacterium]|nr:hypothetical protein [Bacteroidia bacterium]
MDLKYVLNKLIFIAVVAGIFFGLLYYCSHKIDKHRSNRKNQRERGEKLKHNNCPFDEANLGQLKITRGTKTWVPIMSASSLSYYFHDKKFTETNFDETIFRDYTIEGNIFEVIVEENTASLRQITPDEDSPVNFMVEDSLFFSTSDKLEDLKLKFPISYSCRGDEIHQLDVTMTEMRIDNSNFESGPGFIIITFKKDETIEKIEFYY